MPTNPLTSAFLNAIRDSGLKAPWNLLDKQIPYEQKHAHPLRSGTMRTTVKLYYPIVKAVWGYANTELLDSELPFRLVKKSVIGPSGTENQYILEMGLLDNSSLIVVASSSSVRISVCEDVVAGVPVTSSIFPFKDVSEDTLSAIILTILPFVLDIDMKQGSGKLADAVAEIGRIQGANNWTDKNDIPEIAKDALYYTDIVHTILKDKISPEFGNAASSSAEEVSDLSANALSGALVVEKLGTWTPKLVTANGTAAKLTSKNMNIAEARAMYSHFTAHRNWTEKEKSMIQTFPDTMPVMPETLRLAKRICDTRNDVNPVVNAMWRGVTSFGKSTGVKQLSCILNMPLLILTCDPNMEASDLKSMLVPVSEADDSEFEMDNVLTFKPAVAEQDEQTRPPHFSEAVTHLLSLDETERSAILTPSTFYSTALMDQDSACEMLLGKVEDIFLEDLCSLYCEVAQEIKTRPLQKKIDNLEAAGNKEEKKDNAPGFIHVVSNYVRALAKGYLVEIQEPSRIRDSGALVAMNEYERAGSIIHLMNGAVTRRHKDAIVITTDNVGYCSCRPLDPSFIRRHGMVIDSYELTREQLLDRVKRNTGCTDSATLDLGYLLWDTVKSYCEQNAITEGSVSPMELERFIQAVSYDGPDSISVNLSDCIISKATSSIEDQRDIRTACAAVCPAISA